MAIMWPRELPAWVISDPRRAAEISVFQKLERQLDGKWAVFYSRPWWGINQRGGEIDGEADFILVHPSHGLLFLEVKGGGISYDPATSQWKTKDRTGITHNIKDPISQAMTCKHKCLKKLKSLAGWPRGYIRFRHGAVFPDSSPPPSTDPLLGGHEKRLFCHTEEFDSAFEQWIQERLAPHTDDMARSEVGPGEDGIHAVNELLAKPVALRVPMIREVQGETSAMESLLTGAQLASIAGIESTGRAIVEGGAGTGKTVLAMEIAAREAGKGHTVLFCCRSGPLAKRVATRMLPFSTVSVMTFDELRSVFGSPPPEHRGQQPGHSWDVIVIDEAQDFDWEWWAHIEPLIDRPGSRLRIFADSNQAIYRLRDDLETRLGAKSFPLRLNLRNTQRIARVTDSLYRGPLITACGPEGADPISIVCEFEPAKRMASEMLVKLLRQENIPASMIAVLVPDEATGEALRRSLARQGIAVTDADGGSSLGVTVDTVERFKGLESAVVLMITDRELCRNQELSYVGVSRSRNRLFVFGPLAGSLLNEALSPTI